MDPRLQRALEFLTEPRKQKILRSVDQRIGHIHVVLDQVDDPGNRSAVFRTVEALGLLHVHCINTRAPRTTRRPVSVKAEQWLDLEGYSTFEDFLQKNPCLHSSDVWLSQPGPGSIPLGQAFQHDSGERKVWIVFGNEHDGLSPQWSQLTTRSLWIPMAGLMESLNISVAAAISLYGVCHAYRSSHPDSGSLNLQEREALLEILLRRTSKTSRKLLDNQVQNPPGLVDHFLDR